jgi:type VI secretion system protein ImpA
MEVQRLLEPIFDDSPTGENMRLSPGDTTLADIEEMRRVEDPAIDVVGKGKAADWEGVVRACDGALSRKSKDLQLAAHLAEALCYTEGFGGVLDGLKLLQGLLDRYWDRLHPGFEDGEIIEPVRARWISWVGSSRDFLNAVKRIPITKGPGIAERSWADYEASQRVDDASIQANQTAHDELRASGLISGEDWRAALAGTSLERLQRIQKTLTECSESVHAIEAVCQAKFTEDAPNLVELRNLFDDAASYLESRARGATAAPASSSGSSEGASPSARASVPSGAAFSGGTSSGPIGSREDAYRRLQEAADYLRRTEPHSPVSALIERAIRWGDLSFADLLRDVVKSKDAQKSVLEVLGLPDRS